MVQQIHTVDQCYPTPGAPTHLFAVAPDKHTGFNLSTNHQALNELNRWVCLGSQQKYVLLGNTALEYNRQNTLSGQTNRSNSDLMARLKKKMDELDESGLK
jgi:hypothetical protein